MCPSNFTGEQCETSVLGKQISCISNDLIITLATHPCVTMPGVLCQNGGTCTMNQADYICTCAIGFTGRNCQTQEGRIDRF